MSKLLLDTHALLWFVAGDERLSIVARDALADPTHDVFVSAASAWEISTKHRIGKLPDAGPLATDLLDEMTRRGFTALDITVEHGQDAGNLPGPHRDPFDRILIAQARGERMMLVSNETQFDAYGVVRLW